MKLTKLPKHPGEVTVTIIFGAGAIGVAILLGLLVHKAFVDFGYRILIVPLLIPFAFVVGHILCLRLFEKPHTCTCGQTYHNMFSEYFHKRKCLPYITKSVGR